jgi:F-type H+-transporting ATPase subunit epsilon
MEKIKLEIVTAEKLIYSEVVDSIVAPGITGELGILPEHANLVTILDTGVLTITKDGEETDMAVSGGYMEVQPHSVIILADAAERADEIDIDRAEAARARAEEAAKNVGDLDAQLAAEAALKRSLTRLKVAKKRSNRPRKPAQPIA